MHFLESLLGAAQDLFVATGPSVATLQFLHALGEVALGLCLLLVAVRFGLRGLLRRPRTRHHAAFFAIMIAFGLSGLLRLFSPGVASADASLAEVALFLLAGGSSLIAVLLVPGLASKRGLWSPPARGDELHEAHEQLALLYERVHELEDTCGRFASVEQQVRAPRAEGERLQEMRGSVDAAGPDARDTGDAASGQDRYRAGSSVPAREPDDMSAEPEPSRPRVLVVEDNRDLNRFLCRCLGQEFEVLSARNGAEGLEMALQERPDCVLTDVMMPVMGGEQLVSELRSRDELEGIPVVVLTARDDDQLRIKLLKEGVQDFITKPFLTDEVLARVRNLVAAKRAADVLGDELATKRMDLETMAREVARSRHELQTALQQMGVARDLAERASSVKSNFLRMMSHELRTPIAAMQLQLRLMEKHGAEKLEDKQREYLARISRSAQRLLDLVNTVLEYARIESGRFEARVRPFSLSKILQEAADEYQSHAVQKGISLSVTLPDDDMPELSSDPQVVRLIAVNLIGNGVKHTEEGTVEVSADFLDGVHIMWVKDTGPGIPREHQMEVFEPFQRFEDIRQLQGAGSGLGLAIVRDMVRAVGGDISLESDVGKGALFRVTLPTLQREDDDEDVRAPGSFLHH